MWRNMLRTAAATAAFGLVHSALASRTAKDASARLLGRRASDGLYRGFYNAQSAATLAALVAYTRGLDDRELYHARGPLAAGMRCGQAAALAGMAWTALGIGPLRISGLDGLGALATGSPEVPPAAEGHFPSPDADGGLPTPGPFRASRHPMNAAMTALLWLQPRMTANLLAFNAVATAYLVLGSAAEEARLRNRYGARFEAYRRSGVPFLLPDPTAAVADPGPAVLASFPDV